MDLEIRKTVWPIRGRFAISRGARTHARTLTIALREGQVQGRSECVPYSRYGETEEGVVADMQRAFEQLGAFEDARLQLQSLLPPGAARNALDCALWDLEAKLSGRSVTELAGLERPGPAITAFTLSVDTPEAMAEAARAAADKPLLKLKLAGAGDLDRVRSIRAARPDARLIVDANEAWSTDGLAALLDTLADLGVEMVEQPLAAGQDGLLGRMRSPVLLGADESAHATEDLERLRPLYGCVNVKLDKTGGFTEALQMIRHARGLGFKVMLGCMVSSSLAMAPASLLMGMADYVDLDGPLLLETDCEPGLRYRGAEVFPAEPELWG